MKLSSIFLTKYFSSLIFLLWQSASSLLLTVANLENFAKIQEHSRHPHFHPISAIDSVVKIHNKTSIISIHPNNFLSPSHLKPTKELDQLSTASSTHFTMVNGFGRENAKRKSSYICKRSQQVSILIITMSVLFLIGITTAVVLLESESTWKIGWQPYATLNDVNLSAFFLQCATVKCLDNIPFLHQSNFLCLIYNNVCN